MRDDDKQQYLDMIPRVFVRALRDGADPDTEFDLSEGEATDLLLRREQVYANAISKLLPILQAVKFSVGLGKTQLARIEEAHELVRRHAVTDDPREQALQMRDSAYKSFEEAAQNCDALARHAMNETEAGHWRSAAIEWRSAGACKSQEGRGDHIVAANRHERHALASGMSAP